MAQDVTNKKRNVASNTVIHATRLVDALLALDALQEEYNAVTAVSAFAQSDFDGTDLQHLTPALINAVYGGGGNIDDLMTEYANHKTNLLQLRQ